MFFYYFWRDFNKLANCPIDYFLGIIASVPALIMDFIFLPLEGIGLLLWKILS